MSLIEFTIPGVLLSHDMGHDVYDVVLDAKSIHRMWINGMLRIDDDKQRGVNSTNGKQVFKKDKVDRWTEQLLADEHVFGQLTWNYRPEESSVRYDPDTQKLHIDDGIATLPDSAHRHRAIVQAMESVNRGSGFDPSMRFSLRIWRVAGEEEAKIFYGMNQEGDKADATRSKFLMQRNVGQRLARDLVRRNQYMREQNVETVSNTLSAKNPRLMAFNTLAVACEQTFSDAHEAEIPALLEYLDGFWNHLVSVRPELGVLASPQRQEARRTLLSSSALAMHGYIALAKFMRDHELPVDLLEALRPEIDEDFLSLANPDWQAAGLVVPSTSKTGKSTLSTRNAIQTRRVMAETLIARVTAKAEAAAAVAG